jgi:hypothetical protein
MNLLKISLFSVCLGLLLAWLDESGHWLSGWLAYSICLLLAIASIVWLSRTVRAGRRAAIPAWTAFFLRLAIGAALMLLLPVFGYPDSQEHQAGYFYHDAYTRDTQAWQLASHSAPLSRAFSEPYSGDQYGGTLALSAAIYRYLSPDAHRPFLILILTAAASAWGTLLLWSASRAWFGEKTALTAAWIFALYPEGVLLGSSQMREPLVMAAIAMSFYGLVKLQETRNPTHAGRPWGWLAWLTTAGIILFIIQPPLALYAFIILFGLWLLEPGGAPFKERKRALAVGFLFIAILAVSFFMLLLAWSNLPSLQNAGPLEILNTWLQNNFNFQSYLTERSSGMFQKLLEDAGERWRPLIVLGYGAAQPVLPAIVGDPQAAWIMRIAGFWRSLGWYLLAPFLVYGLLAALRATQEKRRAQLLWLGGMIWLWIFIAALSAGGDQWDNPRYRTLLLTWEALVAAWALGWALARKDVWLWRWLLVEAVFIVLFTAWYLARYYHSFPNLGIWTTLAIGLGLSLLILAGGWWWDRRQRRVVD